MPRILEKVMQSMPIFVDTSYSLMEIFIYIFLACKVRVLRGGIPGKYQ